MPKTAWDGVVKKPDFGWDAMFASTEVCCAPSPLPRSGGGRTRYTDIRFTLSLAYGSTSPRGRGGSIAGEAAN